MIEFVFEQDNQTPRVPFGVKIFVGTPFTIGGGRWASIELLNR